MALIEITSLISAIMTTVIGYINIKLLRSQVRLHKKQNKMYEREHQPLFSIEYKRDKTPDSDVFNYEEFCIRNIGYIASSIKISTKCYIKILYTETTLSKPASTYAKLSHYYGILSYTGNQTGEIMKSYHSDSIKNYECFHKIYNDTINFHKQLKSATILIDLIKIFIIEYVDIYETKHTVYLENNNIVNEDYHKTIDNHSLNDYNKIFNIQDLSLKTLIQESNTLNKIINI